MYIINEAKGFVIKRDDAWVEGMPQSYIPISEDNTDYQEYLAWVAEGNTPAPPDEPESP
jgi:hypothetical protein